MIALTKQEFERLVPMERDIDLVELAMIEVSAGRAECPLRSAVPVGGANAMGVMPGALSDPACYGTKLISLSPDNSARGLSSHRGMFILFEVETSGPVAIMDAGPLTALRTSAASAVATRELSREDSRISSNCRNG